MEFIQALLFVTSRGRPEGIMFAIMIFVVVLGILSQRDGSYLRTRTPSEITFSEPWELRAFLASLFGWLVFACASIASEPFDYKPFPWWPVLLASGAVTVGVFRLLGPNQIVFAPQQRTYHSISHWSWPPKTRSGTYDELSGIFVRRVWVKGSSFSSVNLAWKDNSEWPSRLGRFSKPERAQALASELSQTLGLPIVESPPLRKPKSRFSIIQ